MIFSAVKRVARRFLKSGKGKQWNPKESASILRKEAAYERRLLRDTSRVASCFASDVEPVMIHTYGKVGSTAIHKAIGELPQFCAFQTHFVSEEGVAHAAEIHSNKEREPIHLKVGECLRKELESHPDRKVRVITLVRDPVARAVSDLFENPDLLASEEGGDLTALPLEKVVEIAEKHVLASLEYSEKWFDRELSGLFGFDFFGEAFDPAEGFQIMAAGRISLLAGKLEMLSEKGPAILGKFLDLGKDLEIPRRRARDTTDEGALYREVRNKLRLSGDVLDKVYSSRLCRHFYSDSELTKFRSHWIDEAREAGQ